MDKRFVLLFLTFALVLQAHAQKVQADQDAWMKLDDLRRTVEYLASQELGGRYPGTHGDTLASDFIVGKIRSLKLKPIVKGKKKTAYYHDFTYGKT